MYKVDVEDIDKKLGKFQHYRKNHIVPVLMILSGFMVFLGAFEDSVSWLIVLEATLFTILFILHFVVFPLIGKIELMEQDIKNLKEAIKVEDEKHY